MFSNVNRNAMTSEVVKSTLSYGVRLHKFGIIEYCKIKFQKLF